MPRIPTVTAAAFALTSLLFAPAAWSQRSPWDPATVPPAHTVPPPPPAPIFDTERAASPAIYPQIYTGAPPPAPAVLPLSPGRVVAQAGVGWLAGAGGALGAGLLAIPAFLDGEDGLGYAIVYAGWTLASSSTVYGLGRGGRTNGGFLQTLLGASAGGVVGAAMQFWVFDERDNNGVMMLVTGSLITAGAVVGYALSASSAEEIAAGAHREEARLAPAVTPTRDGVLVGAAGRF